MISNYSFAISFKAIIQATVFGMYVVNPQAVISCAGIDYRKVYDNAVAETCQSSIDIHITVATRGEIPGPVGSRRGCRVTPHCYRITHHGI